MRPAARAFMLRSAARILTREPRNGRNFEYRGEDPILPANAWPGVAGTQDQDDVAISTTTRSTTRRTAGHLSANMDKRALRETRPAGIRNRHQGIGRRNGHVRATASSMAFTLAKTLPANDVS